MAKIQNPGLQQAKSTPVEEDGTGWENFKPLTAAEAQSWRQSHRVPSFWWVVVVQVSVGGLAAAVSAFFWSRSMAVSVAYGALAVAIPSAVFARGLSRQRRAPNAGSAMVGFLVWELIKVLLTVFLLVMAPRWVPNLNWIGLVVGLVLAFKVYGLALIWRPGAGRQS